MVPTIFYLSPSHQCALRFFPSITISPFCISVSALILLPQTKPLCVYKLFASALSQSASEQATKSSVFPAAAAAMSRNQPKLKPPPRPFFSCAIFRNCTQSALSPRTPSSSPAAFLHEPLASPSPPPPPPPQPPTAAPPPSTAVPSSSSSSSSSSASHSFTQWRFPLQHSHHQQQHPPPPEPEPYRPPSADSASPLSSNLSETYHAAELHFSAGDSVYALRLLERSLATASPSPPASPRIMTAVVEALRQAETARAAAKVLLAMLLVEGNRRSAVEAGAVSAAVEAVASAGTGATTVKERTLAALELLCTVEEGATEVRAHALAPAALARSVEGMTGRGRECAIGILAAIYAGDGAADAPAVVAHAVVVALQGECSARGRRKGAQLLRALKERSRLDLADIGDDC